MRTISLLFAFCGVLLGIQGVEKPKLTKKNSQDLFFLYTSFVDQVIATPTQAQDYFGCLGNTVACAHAYTVEVPHTRVPSEDIFDTLP